MRIGAIISFTSMHQSDEFRIRAYQHGICNVHRTMLAFRILVLSIAFPIYRDVCTIFHDGIRQLGGSTYAMKGADVSRAYS